MKDLRTALQAIIDLATSAIPQLEASNEFGLTSTGLLKNKEKKCTETDPLILRLFGLFNRRPTRVLNEKESIALKKAAIQEDDMQSVEEFYNDVHPEWEGQDYRRRNLLTLLNNWNSDVDKADNWKAFPPPPPKKTPIFSKS